MNLESHPFYDLLSRYIYYDNILEGENFNFKSIFQISENIVRKYPAFVDGDVNVRQSDPSETIVDYFNKLSPNGIALDKINSSSPVKVKSDEFTYFSSSNEDDIGLQEPKEDEIDLDMNDKLEIREELTKYFENPVGKEKPIYILYGDKFNGKPRSRDRVAHISAVLLYNNEMYSFGWGTDGENPSLLKPYEISRKGYIMSPEVTQARRSGNLTDIHIFDIGYFTVSMYDKLKTLINNTKRLVVSSALSKYVISEGKKKISVYQININDYKSELKDFKYWIYSGSIANKLVRKFNCTTFMEFIFDNRISCASRGLCPSLLGDFKFVTSDPSSCFRNYGTGNNYLDIEKKTDYNTLLDKIDKNIHNLDMLGGKKRTKKSRKNKKKISKKNNNKKYTKRIKSKKKKTNYV